MKNKKKILALLLSLCMTVFGVAMVTVSGCLGGGYNY